MRIATRIHSLLILAAAATLVMTSDLSAQDEPTSAPHHDHEGMAHDFSNAEHWSEVFDAPERDAWQMPDHVVALLELAPGMRVVDLGAGTGYFLPHLSAAVGSDGRVMALEVEANLVDYMFQRIRQESLGNVLVQHISTDSPNLTPASVDRVLIVNTWHHIQNREAYSRLLYAGLRPGGAVYIVDFTLESERGPSVDHRLAPDAVMAELEAGGLETALLEEGLPDQYVVVGRRTAAPQPDP